MGGNTNDLLDFCRTYLYFMAKEIGLEVEINMEPDSEYTMSIKTRDGRKPILGGVSDSRDLDEPEVALSKARERLYSGFKDCKMIFFSLPEETIFTLISGTSRTILGRK